MKRSLHTWDLSPREAVELQKQLRSEIHTNLRLSEPRCLAGVDVAYEKGTGISVATVVVLAFPSLQVVDSAVARTPTRFPYVPGLLSFREVPPILDAIKKLRCDVDLYFVDGHGRAHPRRIGIASHFGLWVRKPTIGIGKSRLCGSFQMPGKKRGDYSELVDHGDVIGAVLRTRPSTRPVFVSVGYGISLACCIEWTLAASTGFRLPEPIRQADRLARLSKQKP